MKKNKTFGTNGNVNAGYNIGIYAKYNGGFSLNHRNAKTNIFGNYNYSQGLNESNFTSYRIQSDSIFDQKNRILSKNKYSHNFKAGVDFFIDKNSTFGVVVNGNIADNNNYTAGPMKIIYAPTNTIVRTLVATGDNLTTRDNMNFNLNYRYAKTGGSELNIDADYGFYDLRTHQYQPNDYYAGTTNVKLFSNIYRTVSPTNIDIYSVKADYEQNFKKGRLGYGGKIGFVNTDNDFARWNVDNANNEVYDNDASNRFRYKENINAAYVNYNRAYKGFMLQAGLRLENTSSDGRTTGLKKIEPIGSPSYYVNLDTTVSRNYTNLFPSAAITFNKNPMSQFGITFSRRIDRPAYQDLNPFEFKINDYTYMKGNTQLRPQYTNSIGFTHTYKYRLNTQLSYSHVKDIFAQIPDTLGSKSFLTKKNLANQDIVNLNISYPYQYKWYSFFANLGSNYSMYRASIPDLAGNIRKININVAAVSFFMQNTFNLGKTYKAELSGFYNSPTVYAGTIKARAMYSVDGGLQKTILKGKGNLKASVSDMFNLMRFKGSVDFAGAHTDVLAKWESRQFKLNFSYRFGNMQVKAARQRKASIEEENKRTQQSGGMGVGGQ
ncbi:MAG: outer membrane beta-barrel family protein [Ferruginibacter sp.]